MSRAHTHDAPPRMAATAAGATVTRVDRPDWCRCQRRTSTHRNAPTVQVPPVLLATWRDEQLVDVRRRHTCGMADEILDPADWGAPDNPPHAATLTTTPHPASEVPHG